MLQGIAFLSHIVMQRQFPPVVHPRMPHQLSSFDAKFAYATRFAYADVTSVPHLRDKPRISGLDSRRKFYAQLFDENPAPAAQKQQKRIMDD